ncbi:MAG: hypothetical protein DI585_02355 [Pseudomonas fluorescens]|nr:MAG: hypothetical protein DI585_02355 [Pseudomonas fluorescens]
MLNAANSTPFAVYVHWPWCKAKCPYCDFNSHESTIHEETYVRAVLNDFHFWGDSGITGDHKTSPFFTSQRPIASLFFGGGTPSLMSAHSLAQIIDSCSKLGKISHNTEITLECNPTSFDSNKEAIDFFNELKSIGINRVSIGIQGLKQEWLEFLGRHHSAEESLKTLDAAQQVFDNVNADVIYGLPSQKLEEWTDQLSLLAERNLAHISAYQLTIEPNTHFFRDVRKGLWEPVSSDVEADFFDATREILSHHNYINYEISNFAKPGKHCVHNTHVWQYGEYLGIGAGAHGRVRTEDNHIIATHVIRQPDGYLRRTANSEPTIITHSLTAAETAQEAIFLGLRLLEGVDMESLQKTFGKQVYEEAISTSDITLLCQSGLLQIKANHLQLTQTGWPRLNAILSRILRPLNTPNTTKQNETPSNPTAYKPPRYVVIK